jgi:hypothetical protein
MKTYTFAIGAFIVASLLFVQADALSSRATTTSVVDINSITTTAEEMNYSTTVPGVPDTGSATERPTLMEASLRTALAIVSLFVLAGFFSFLLGWRAEVETRGW